MVLWWVQNNLIIIQHDLSTRILLVFLYFSLHSSLNIAVGLTMLAQQLHPFQLHEHRFRSFIHSIILYRCNSLSGIRKGIKRTRSLGGRYSRVLSTILNLWDVGSYGYLVSILTLFISLIT
jgi:hypothetical protein